MDPLEPTARFRVLMDVEIVPADVSAERACQIVAVALETAYSIVRGASILQCSRLDGLQGRGEQ